jgi:biopolymer transport protein ExbB
MLELSNALEAIRDFLELGGPVLRLIAWVILFMWILILERIIFFRTGLATLTAEAVAQWESRSERRSWYAHEIRAKMISKVNMAAGQGLPMIQTFVALCPLLGLLGTVTGMISVFEVMAISGSGNARSMAAGVSRATIPTMAGMVGALSGVFLVTILTRTAKRSIQQLEDSMVMDHSSS